MTSKKKIFDKTKKKPQVFKSLKLDKSFKLTTKMDGLTFVNQLKRFFIFFVICVERLTLYISIVWLWYIRSARLISNMDAWKRRKKILTWNISIIVMTFFCFFFLNINSIITFYSYFIHPARLRLHNICPTPIISIYFMYMWKMLKASMHTV